MANSTILYLQKNIKKYREEKILTQEQLADKAGISADYISEIERGKKTPSIKRLLLIAEALEIDIEALFKEIN